MRRKGGNRRRILPGLLSVAVLLSGCGTEISSQVCPRVTEFPAELQAQAARELANMPTGSALPRMMDAMVVDRAFNRALCGRR